MSQNHFFGPSSIDFGCAHTRTQLTLYRTLMVLAPFARHTHVHAFHAKCNVSLIMFPLKLVSVRSCPDKKRSGDVGKLSNEIMGRSQTSVVAIRRGNTTPNRFLAKNGLPLAFCCSSCVVGSKFLWLYRVSVKAQMFGCVHTRFVRVFHRHEQTDTSFEVLLFDF